jgi:TRAP-type C4-dicarboxylate transport system substrate-binding protein
MNLSGLKLKTSQIGFVLLLAVFAGGCASKQTPAIRIRPAANSAAPIVTPDFSLAAKVISVNTIGRFVILSFPASQMPKVEQTLFLYRGGLKVAQVRITGPQSDSNIVADLISGEAQVDDTVRDQ